MTLPDTRYRLVMGVALFILIPAIAKIASVPEATTAPHQPTGQMAGADSAMEEVSLPPTATMTPPLLPTTVALVPDQGEVIRRRPLHPVSTPTLTPVPPKAIRVPILMYHHIADPPVGADAIRVDLSVSPASFADQMAFLVRNRYQTVTLGDLAGALTAGTPLPQRPVILTFDDGYDDNYLNAFPILQAWGLTGTFFIITDLVGSREYMSWEDLRVMASHGMDIEAHGRTHRDLTQLSADGVAWQARGAKTILEERLGRPVLFYAYPSGRYSTMAIRVLQDLGFRGAVATTYGATHTVSDMFSLSRVRVRRTDTLETFARKLEEAP